MESPPVSDTESAIQVMTDTSQPSQNLNSYYSETSNASLSMSERNKHDSLLLSGSVFLITSDGQTLSLPVPSQSPRDPLNWTRFQRIFSMIVIGLFSALAILLSQAAGSLMNGITIEFAQMDIRPFTTETLPSATVLAAGLGPFVWIPLSLALGRRPVFIIAALFLFLGTLGAGLSESFNHILASVCLIGFTDGFANSTALLMIIDLTFIHQRPSAIAKLWSIATAAAGICLASAPYITQNGKKWRSFYLFWCIPVGITFVAAFFVQETYFKRPTVAYDGLTIVQSATEKVTAFEKSDFDEDVSSVYDKDLPETPYRSKLRALRDSFTVSRSSSGSWKSAALCYPQILFCLFNLLIFWIVLVIASIFAGLLFIGGTYSATLSAPPYKFSRNMLILSNSVSSVGALLAWPLSGPILGCILKHLARRNKGVREAEHYLVGFFLPITIGALTALLYFLALHHHWHYSVLFLDSILLGFSYTAISIVNTLWVTEAFPRWAAPALAAVAGMSRLITFAISFAAVPWFLSQGNLGLGIELAAIEIILGLVCMPIAFWGKGLRQRIHGKWAERREGALRPL